MVKKLNKVVIITYDMIPHSSTWGGAQRMYFLSEYLTKADIEVTVFSCKKHTNNYYGNKTTFKNISIDVQNKFFNKFIYSRGLKQESKTKDSLSFLNALRRYLKRNKFLFTFLNKMDKKIYNEPSFLSGSISRSWIKSTKDTIIQYMQDNEIKNVIISAPPFGMFSVAKDIKTTLANCNIIFDYRDPWNLWKNNGFFPRMIERKYLKYADSIVCTNVNLANDMSKIFNIDRSKFYIIENGYSSNVWGDILNSNINATKNKMMTLTYVGAVDIELSSTFGYRDITHLLEALDKCLENGIHIIIKFIGVLNTNSEYAQFLKEKYNGNLQFEPIMENKKANKMMLVSDVLLLLHTVCDNSSKYIISGKIYDYIKANKMILSIGDESGIHATMMREESLGLSSKNETMAIYNQLLKLHTLWKEDKTEANLPNIERFSREFQYQKYIKLCTSNV